MIVLKPIFKLRNKYSTSETYIQTLETLIQIVKDQKLNKYGKI